MATQPVVIKFFAPVMDATINALMQTVDQKLSKGQRDFIILISSPGGSVFHGLSAYHYLKGIPAEVSTHNFGSVDSIGVILYCAGRKRLCVPQARFLLHGVTAGFPQAANLEEKQLEERLKGLKIDIENIAKVVAANTGKSVQENRRTVTAFPRRDQNVHFHRIHFYGKNLLVWKKQADGSWKIFRYMFDEIPAEK